MRTCLSCKTKLTTLNAAGPARLCRDCALTSRHCAKCRTVKPLDTFPGKSAYTCSECQRIARHTGNKVCKTCGTSLPAIDFRPNAKDCPNCFGKRRRCNKCKEIRPLEDFHRVAGGQGIRRVCKSCVAMQRRNDYRSQPKPCDVCGRTKQSFKLNSNVCSDCYGESIRCPRCDNVKQKSEFHVDISRPTGRQAYCKSCLSAQAPERRKDSRKCQRCKSEKPLTDYQSETDKVCTECRSSTKQLCVICGVARVLAEFPKNDQYATGHETRCNSCNAKRAHKKSKRDTTRHSMAKSSALRRNLEFTIEFEEHSTFMKQPCHYCGHPLNNTGSGLDRIDPTRGYTPDNVVPCCRQCNWTKSDYFTYDEMVVIGEAIGRVKTQRTEHDESETL